MFTPAALPLATVQPKHLRSGPEFTFRALGWLLAGSLNGPAQAAVATNGVITVPVPGTNSVADALNDIRGPVVIPSGWAWLGRVLLVLALAALGWWAWRRHQRRKQELPSTSTVPPEDKARERLREILALLGQPQPFCFAMTETVRTYLEEKFGLRAPEQTTEEFLESLQHSIALDRRHKGVLEDFLTRCDMVKFAKVEVRREELEELHAAALRLVDETTGYVVPRHQPRMPMEEVVRELRRETEGSSEEEGDARYMPPKSEAANLAAAPDGTGRRNG